ncbi:hypothetical protein BJF90_43680 [Pseudonocardia sp. CNS-004]|nr:hypothetical protein BJF90_43680 [Pseudonocardia sp. CNS-004]
MQRQAQVDAPRVEPVEGQRRRQRRLGARRVHQVPRDDHGRVRRAVGRGHGEERDARSCTGDRGLADHVSSYELDAVQY